MGHLDTVVAGAILDETPTVVDANADVTLVVHAAAAGEESQSSSFFLLQ